MIVLTKEQVVSNIFKTSNMDAGELQAYREKVSLSDIDDKAKSFLYRAVDLRQEMLDKRVDPKVTYGDVSDIVGAEHG